MGSVSHIPGLIFWAASASVSHEGGMEEMSKTNRFFFMLKSSSQSFKETVPYLLLSRMCTWCTMLLLYIQFSKSLAGFLGAEKLYTKLGLNEQIH